MCCMSTCVTKIMQGLCDAGVSFRLSAKRKRGRRSKIELSFVDSFYYPIIASNKAFKELKLNTREKFLLCVRLAEGGFLIKDDIGYRYLSEDKFAVFCYAALDTSKRATNHAVSLLLEELVLKYQDVDTLYDITSESIGVSYVSENDQMLTNVYHIHSKQIQLINYINADIPIKGKTHNE